MTRTSTATVPSAVLPRAQSDGGTCSGSAQPTRAATRPPNRPPADPGRSLCPKGSPAVVCGGAGDKALGQAGQVLERQSQVHHRSEICHLAEPCETYGVCFCPVDCPSAHEVGPRLMHECCSSSMEPGASVLRSALRRSLGARMLDRVPIVVAARMLCEGVRFYATVSAGIARSVRMSYVRRRVGVQLFTFRLVCRSCYRVLLTKY